MIPSPLQTLRSWLRPSERPPAAADDGLPPGIDATRLGDILTYREAWQAVEGFRQPDWRKLGEFVRGRTADEAERAALWHDASLQWLRALRQDLGGGGYHVVESRHLLLLSAYSRFAARGIVQECDAILQHLRARLKGAAWHWPHGKHVVLLFEDEEPYYRYISHFYEDGRAYGTSSGIFLKGGYRHTALFKDSGNRHTLAHEFVHLCLSHLPQLPRWLNEGLAAYLSEELTDPRSRAFDRDAAKAQRTFWTPATIQDCWSGEAFRVDEECKMSYNLAEILVGLMWRQLGDLVPFILAAQRANGGENAARRYFDLSLGEVAAAVLGEGDWQPRPPPATAKS